MHKYHVLIVISYIYPMRMSMGKPMGGRAKMCLTGIRYTGIRYTGIRVYGIRVYGIRVYGIRYTVYGNLPIFAKNKSAQNCPDGSAKY